MAGRFFIPVSSGILDPRHVSAIGPAIWTYLWLLDRMVDESGRVLHGRAVTMTEVSAALGVDASSISRHLSRLEEHGYVESESPDPRAPKRYRVTKPKGKPRWITRGQRAGAAPPGHARLQHAPAKMQDAISSRASSLLSNTNALTREPSQDSRSSTSSPSKAQGAPRALDLRDELWNLVKPFADSQATKPNPELAAAVRETMAAAFASLRAPRSSTDGLLQAVRDMTECWKRSIYPNPFAFLRSRTPVQSVRVEDRDIRSAVDTLMAFTKSRRNGGS